MVAMTLANAGFPREARIWAQKARALGGDEGEYHGLEASLARMDADAAIRRNRPDAAIAAFRRAVEKELLQEQRMNRGQKAQIHYSMFYFAAHNARRARAHDCAGALLDYVQELEKADLLRDKSTGQSWRRQTHEVLDPARHRAEREKLIEERAGKFREAEAMADPSEAISKLLDLRSNLYRYEADS